MMLLNGVSTVKQTVGLTIHQPQLEYPYSYKKQDLLYTGLDWFIDSPTKSRTSDTLVSTSILIVLQKVGLTILWSRLVYRSSYKRQDLQYTGLNQCIHIPTKIRTYDTLVSTGVSIALQKVGLTTHWSRLVHRQSYKKQDLQYFGLDQCLDGPTKRRTYTGLNQCIHIPTKIRTYDTLVSSGVSIVLQKVRLTIHWSRLVYRQSYKKQDLQYTDLDQCIDSPTKRKTYDTLVLTIILIVLYKVGLTIHSSRLVIHQPRPVFLQKGINSLSIVLLLSRTNGLQD